MFRGAARDFAEEAVGPLVQRMDEEGRSAMQLAQGSDPSWSADGRRIVYARPAVDRSAGTTAAVSWHLWAISADGSDQRQLATDVFEGSYPALSPDGRSLAFVSARAGSPDIRLLQATTSGGQRGTPRN